MNEHRVNVYSPLAPSAETMKTPARTLLSADGKMLVTYCPQNACGAIYHFDLEMWSMWSPIRFAQFASVLAARGIVLPDGAETRDWMNSCTACGSESALH